MPDDGIDILKDTDDRPARLHLPELFHALGKGTGVLTEKRDVALIHNAADDLVDQRGLAAALLAPKKIAAPMEKAVTGKQFAFGPKPVDLFENLRRKAAGEIDQVIGLQIPDLKNGVTGVVHHARVSTRR